MPGQSLDSYGPLQLGDRVGLTRFQVSRARAAGLIPDPDRDDGRWSPSIVDRLISRAEEIRAEVGGVPNVGASRAAVYLTERLGTDVTPGMVAELSTAGLLPVVGDFRGRPLYDGWALEQIDSAALADHSPSPAEPSTAEEADPS